MNEFMSDVADMNMGDGYLLLRHLFTIVRMTPITLIITHQFISF